jgi:hypothetical protein
MVELCDQVRLYNPGLRSEVLVETGDWLNVMRVPQSCCFAPRTSSAHVYSSITSCAFAHNSRFPMPVVFFPFADHICEGEE